MEGDRFQRTMRIYTFFLELGIIYLQMEKKLWILVYILYTCVIFLCMMQWSSGLFFSFFPPPPLSLWPNRTSYEQSFVLRELLNKGIIVGKRKSSKRDTLFFVHHHLYFEIRVNGKLLDDLFIQWVFVEHLLYSSLCLRTGVRQTH